MARKALPRFTPPVALRLCSSRTLLRSNKWWFQPWIAIPRVSFSTLPAFRRCCIPWIGSNRMSRIVKCLLVDDLPENLLALSELLRQEDVEILEARTGNEALEILLVHDVALALLDVQMPDMDGFELAELMRGSARTRHVPIIFVTAGARDQHRMFKGYESGAVDFLYKPVEPQILQNKAAVFFQLDRQRRQLDHELRERTETLRLNEMFTALLAHDLRNPLNAILTSAHLVQR